MIHEKIIGTSLQGYVTADYSELCKAFGSPGNGDGYKIDAQWIVEDGEIVATVYNYKDGPNYMGEDGRPVRDIMDWHIGGKDERAIDLVRRRLGR